MRPEDRLAEDPTLRQGLSVAVTRLGLLLPPGAEDRLLAFLDQLLRWNRVFNLTAIRDPAMALTQHLVDCLATVVPIDRRLSARQSGLSGQPAILDVGSGGGLPGVVLAIARPQWTLWCVDSVAKKTSFVQQAAAELDLQNVTAVHGRVQDLSLREGGFDAIISRAFSSLDEFASLTKRHLAQSGEWVAMKGQHPEAELSAMAAEHQVFHVEPLQVPGLDAQRCLVWMRPARASTDIPQPGRHLNPR